MKCKIIQGVRNVKKMEERRYTGKPEQRKVQTGERRPASRNADLKEQGTDPNQERRRQRRAQQRARRAREVRRQRFFAVAAAAVMIFVIAAGTHVVHRAWAKSSLSDEVLSYRSTVEKYAKKEGISEYVDTLLAIMMVESEGKGRDVMQSSESKGLDRNSLEPEESIEQACIYYAALINIAHNLKIKDDKAIIQAYNFGPSYLSYVAKHGAKHTQKLAISFSKKQSGGEKIRYLHLIAIKKNGGWLYKFGNMFYEALVEKYL